MEHLIVSFRSLFTFTLETSSVVKIKWLHPSAVIPVTKPYYKILLLHHHNVHNIVTYAVELMVLNDREMIEKRLL